MDYIHATLILHETGREINEENLTAVLEATGTDVVESRVKAIVAALEGVDIEAIAPKPEFDSPDVSPKGEQPTGGEPEIAGADDEVAEGEADHGPVVEEEPDGTADDGVESGGDRGDSGNEGEFEFSSAASGRHEAESENRPSRGEDSDEGGTGAG